MSDGQESDSELIQITVTNVNEAPVFIQNSYSISGNEGLVSRNCKQFLDNKYKEQMMA